jgi:hypothetical protein
VPHASNQPQIPSARYTHETTLPLLAALLLSPLAALHAADSPSQKPPQHIGPPLAEHAATNRACAGIPSMAVAPEGRLWATWYAGVTPAEDLNHYVVLSTSGDDGKSWTEVLIVDPDGGGPVRSFDPELWVSPEGRLFFFWAQMQKGPRDAVSQVFDAYRTGETDSSASCVDLGKIEFATCDNLHPTSAAHEQIFKAALPAFEAIRKKPNAR